MVARCGPLLFPTPSAPLDARRAGLLVRRAPHVARPKVACRTRKAAVDRSDTVRNTQHSKRRNLRRLASPCGHASASILSRFILFLIILRDPPHNIGLRVDGDRDGDSVAIYASFVFHGMPPVGNALVSLRRQGETRPYSIAVRLTVT